MFGVQPMPFNSFLFALWAMVVKEAHTSESVKQLAVDAKGVDDKGWEGTYMKETGGILTIHFLMIDLGLPLGC
jgi:enoyl reductase-like protein